MNRALVVIFVLLALGGGVIGYLLYDTRGDLGRNVADTQRLDRALSRGSDNYHRLRSLQRDLTATQRLSDRRFAELLHILHRLGIDTSSIDKGGPDDPSQRPAGGPVSADDPVPGGDHDGDGAADPPSPGPASPGPATPPDPDPPGPGDPGGGGSPPASTPPPDEQGVIGGLVCTTTGQLGLILPVCP